MRTSPLSAATLALAATLLAGCGGDPNTSISVGGQPPVEVFNPDAVAFPPRQGQTPDSPSLVSTTLSREHWPARSLDVPLDRPFHQPTYRFNRDSRAYTTLLARQRGEFPTQSSALDLGSNPNTGDQALEGLAMPVLVAAELVALPFRLFTDPVHERERSTEHASPRTPGTIRITDLLGPDADTAVGAPRDFGPIDLAKLPPDAFIFRDGRWIPVPEALNPPPVVPAPAPSVSPTPAPAAPTSSWVAPTTPGSAAAAPRPATPATPGNLDQLPDDSFVFRDGRWMTVREARSLNQPAAPRP